MAEYNRLDVFVYAVNDRFYGISDHPNILMAAHVVWKKREIIARHTATCVFKSSMTAFARYAWFMRFPLACRDCDCHYENSVGDTCHCVEAGCCPRCGEQLHYDVATFNEWLEKRLECPFCGFSHGRELDDYPIPAYQCYCWEGRLTFS